MLSVSVQTLLCRGYYAVRSGLNTRIRNQTEQGQQDVGAAVIRGDALILSFFNTPPRTVGFHQQKSQQVLENAGACAIEVRGQRAA